MEAKSIEEVERLKALLQAGQMPNAAEQKQHQNGHKSNAEAMEQEPHSGQSFFISFHSKQFVYSRKQYDGNLNDKESLTNFFYDKKHIVIVSFVYYCSLFLYTKPDESKESCLLTFCR